MFLNGRELPPAELELIERLVGPFASGRYFLDGDGYVGFEDGTRLLNLLELISRAESLLCHQAMHLRAGERAFDDDMAGTCDDALAEIDTVRVTRRAR